jgi:phosphoglucomutase/phosphomannomutase
MYELDNQTIKNVNSWLDGSYDEETKNEIRHLQSNPKELIDCFYTNLEFGTAGLRGIMGVGTNRMNRYTVCAATQGLANYLKTQPGNNFSVFIGYDSRHNSRTFAEEASKVLAANGIKVYLTKELRPTPLVSFGCRYKKCSAAIMITASHNPPEYNGYKVYWNDGGQVLPPHDIGIIREAEKITDFSQVKTLHTLDSPLIEEVLTEVDNAYYSAIANEQLLPEQNKKHGAKLKVVYTSLHGTGITMIREALHRWGFDNIILVAEQVTPDGDFPHAPSANPEEKKALELGIEYLKKYDADLLIANDPDADRVGIVVRHGDEITILNGNQTCCLLAEHVCHARAKQKNLPANGAFIKTIVTTEMMKDITDKYSQALFNVLPGFKYIAEKIREWESKKDSYSYLFGGEESYGYLLGTATRDKDAIICSALICEAALNQKLQNKTLVDALKDLYKTYGQYVETLFSAKYSETKEGKDQMAAAMERLRRTPPKIIGNSKVVIFEDYLSRTKIDLRSGETTAISLPKSNILLFRLEDQTKIVIRPSGTEPKIKLYCGTVDQPEGTNEKYLEQVRSLLK